MLRMVFKNPIIVGVLVLTVVGGIQQYRLERARLSTTTCELALAHQRSIWATAQAEGALEALRVTAEAEAIREQLARERRQREQEVEDRQEREDAIREAERRQFEARLKEAAPSCQAWRQEVVPCPVE